MISRIEIENFKSIRTLSLEMRLINVFIGANGAGKSNFIGFLKLLRKISEARLQQYVAEEAGADNFFHHGVKKSASMGGKINFDDINIYEFSLRPDATGGCFIASDLTKFNKEKGDYGMKGWDEVTLSTSVKESALSTSGGYRVKHVNGFLSSFRVFHFHDTSKEARGKLMWNDIHDNHYLKEDGSNLPAFLYFLQEKHPSHFKRIEAIVRSVAPFFDRFVLQPTLLDETKIRLEWQEKGSDIIFNASHLSDGTLRFIALVTLFLQPDPPRTIIIDEPELGLHPFAINKLAGLIRAAAASNIQVIVSTQSVELMNNFDPEDIITVDRANGQSVFHRHSSEELQKWLEDYSLGELWNKNVIGGRP